MEAHDARAERLVPHRGGMLWIDRVIHCDAEGVVAEATIRAEHLMAEDAAPGLPAWFGIEYMAQTIAAWAGARDWRAGREPGIGFLLGSRRYECDVPAFPVGSVLTVQVSAELIGDNGLGMFACRILQQDRVLATANVSVFEPPDAAAYLESGEA